MLSWLSSGNGPWDGATTIHARVYSWLLHLEGYGCTKRALADGGDATTTRLGLIPTRRSEAVLFFTGVITSHHPPLLARKLTALPPTPFL